MAAQDFFGLDVGTSSIKAVQVKREGIVSKLVTAGYIVAPIKKVLSESAVDQESIASAISKLISSLKISTSNVVSALPESQIFTRVIEMPILNDRELASAIKWEAEQYIPVPLTEVNLAWQVLSRPVKVEAGAKMEVLLIAAPKVLVEKHVKILKMAGLNPVGLETEVVAAVRALVDKASPTTVVISIGAYTTDICIARMGILSSTRSIATGGEALTKAIAEDLGFDQAQAEEYKKTYGLLENELEGKIMATIKPVFEVIVGEIKKAILAYESKKSGDQVKRVILSGGGGKLPGAIEYLVSEFGLEVQLGDPWFFLEKGPYISKQLLEDRPLFAIATGLALRKI
jgi:type IV pilus assembly protein PilM